LRWHPASVSQVGEGVERQASAPIRAQEVRGQAPSADETSQIDDDEVSWNPFERPADLSAAERLSRYGLIAGGLLVAGDVVLLGALGLNSLTGATLEDGSTYASMLLPSAAFLLLMLAIDAGLTFASWRWRSRWSAIGLLVMALLTTGGSMLEILDGRTIWRVIQLAVGVGAVFFAIQALRGAFWLKAMGGMAGLQAQRIATESELASAYRLHVPPATRRRWLGLAGVAAVVVAAIGVLSVLSRQGDDPSAGGAAVSLSEPPVAAEAAPLATDTPMLALPPLVAGQPFADARQQLIAAGYVPMPINLNAECPGGLCQAYPEVMECSGMGASPDAQLYAPCTLR